MRAKNLLERSGVGQDLRVYRDPRGAVVLEGVMFLGARSANRNPDGTHNVYPLSARRAAQELYEGAKVFVDHPERSNPGRPRSVREQIGRLQGPFTHTARGSYAKLVLNPMHPLTESIEWDARNAPDSLGLSHNAVGLHRARGKDCLVEKITRVRSVDLVCNGATTVSLFESLRDDLNPIEKTLTMGAFLEYLTETSTRKRREVDLLVDRL